MTGSDGAVLRDEAVRPRLRCLKHDWQFGWFDLIARRHGEHSLEVRQAREMLNSITFRQCYLFEIDGTDEAPSENDLPIKITTGGKTVKTDLGTLKEFAEDRDVTLIDHGRPMRMKASRVAEHILKGAKGIDLLDAPNHKNPS